MLVISETWVSKEEQDFYGLPGFKAIFASRIKRGGGVYILIRNSIKYNTVKYASQPSENREENDDNFANPTQIEENSGATSNSDLVSDFKKEKEKFMKPPTPKHDPTLMYTQHLANKLRQFSGRTKAMIEHTIDQIIFEAEMGQYDNPLFRTQVPTPAFSPNAAQGSPWSAHSNSSSNDNPHFRTQVQLLLLLQMQRKGLLGQLTVAVRRMITLTSEHKYQLLLFLQMQRKGLLGQLTATVRRMITLTSEVPNPAFSSNAAQGSPWSNQKNKHRWKTTYLLCCSLLLH
ncbi:unnamed protein product [Brassicogethes aeneus]|uniref:Uncharacterized protein n=1 Tax=Brassicogethes aeneus TaxID=1431903 RepID=A0A9P0BB15_BRAAE|nr:unnamed protein product [Brassicogethes aeneus]